MEKTLGARIASLRRKKSMTQEALARAVGVSAPAVSKWETDASCPDIALLCPLARALGTNVDTLLAVEEELTCEQINSQINRLAQMARSGDISGAQEEMEKLLHPYPSSAGLRYNAALMMDMFLLMGMVNEDLLDARKAYRLRKRELLEGILNDVHYHQLAATALASMALEDGELERAEELLGEPPLTDTNSIVLRTRLYHQRGEEKRALEEVQKELFRLITRAQNCLILLMGEKMQPDPHKRLQIAQISCEMDRLFGVNAGFSVGLLFEQHVKAGNEREALSALDAYVDVMIGPIRQPNPLLFSPTYKKKDQKPAAAREMRQMLLKGLREEESVASLRGYPAFEDAMRRLEESLREEE